jgi:hypothetical protein
VKPGGEHGAATSVETRQRWRPCCGSELRLRSAQMGLGAVTSFEASSWGCSFFPASTTGGNPSAGPRFGRRRACIVSALGASPRWFVESLVCLLESMAAAAQSAGCRALYTLSSALHGRRSSTLYTSIRRRIFTKHITKTIDYSKETTI